GRRRGPRQGQVQRGARRAGARGARRHRAGRPGPCALAHRGGRLVPAPQPRVRVGRSRAGPRAGADRTHVPRAGAGEDRSRAPGRGRTPPGPGAVDRDGAGRRPRRTGSAYRGGGGRRLAGRAGPRRHARRTDPHRAARRGARRAAAPDRGRDLPARSSGAIMSRPAPRSPHTAARLVSALESTGPRPALAWYGEAARIELSGHVVANWVIKAIGHLHDEIALDPDDEVVVDLPPYWKRLTLAVAGWALGARCTVLGREAGAAPEPLAGAEEPRVVITDRPGSPLAETADEVLAVEAVSLAPRFGAELPPLAHDWLVEVRGSSDRLGVALPPGSGPAAEGVPERAGGGARPRPLRGAGRRAALRPACWWTTTGSPPSPACSGRCWRAAGSSARPQRSPSTRPRRRASPGAPERPSGPGQSARSVATASVGSPSKTARPLRSTTMRVQSFSSISSSWETTIMVRPAFCSSRMRSRHLRWKGSSPTERI